MAKTSKSDKPALRSIRHLPRIRAAVRRLASQAVAVAETIADLAELYFFSRIFGFELAEPIEPVTIENLQDA